MSHARRIAVVDVGTNSARMQVAELRPDGSIVIVGDEKVSTRLGDSVFQSGGIHGKTFEQGVVGVVQLVKHAEAAGVDYIRAVATSALREADNGPEFAKRIEAETGVCLEVISGAEEARLIHLGACEDFPGRSSVLIFDIGGGSTEVAVGRGEELWMTSLRAGSARLTRYFIHADPPRQSEMRVLETFLDGQFASRWTGAPEAAVYLGTAGTNGAIGDLLEREGSPYDLAGVSALLDRLVKLDLEARRKYLGPKEAQRADIIIAGLAIAKSFLEVTRIKELTYSSRGLRDGLLVEEAVRAGLRPLELGDARALRRRKLLQLGALYDFDRMHAQKVAEIAVSLFDQLGDLHGLGSAERDLLEAAALLHDIGNHISYSKHHKHTYYLIKNSELAGFDEEEVEIIANIARYHRKAHPSEKHAPYKALAKDERRNVQMLAGILRLADACDRRHAQVVNEVKTIVSPEAVTLKLCASDSAEVEVWSIEQRAAELFETAFAKKVSVAVGPCALPPSPRR